MEEKCPCCQRGLSECGDKLFTAPELFIDGEYVEDKWENKDICKHCLADRATGALENNVDAVYAGDGKSDGKEYDSADDGEEDDYGESD